MIYFYKGLVSVKVIIPVLSMGRSGGERVLSKLATELIRLGNDVVFITPASDRGPYYPTEATVIYSEKSKSNNKFVRYFVTLYNLWRKCKGINADLVLANYHPTAYIAAMLLTRKQRFYYVQAYEVNFSGSILGKLFAYLTYLLPLNKIVNSNNLLPESLNSHVAVVPAGIDNDLFFDDKLPEMQGLINIGLIGRIEPHKGTKEALFILAEYIRENMLDDKVKVNVAVYLPEINFNIKNIAHYSIGSDDELASFYKENDIFIATGLVEDGAFHYPCAEAMAAGCLVISNYAPLTSTSSVLKIKTFSKTELFSALDCCFKNELDISFCVRENQKLMEEYSWEKIGNKMYNAIAGL